MLKRLRTLVISSILIVSPLSILTAGVAHAYATYTCGDTWTGASGTDSNWTTAGNWSNNAIPAAASTVCIDNSATFTAGIIAAVPAISLNTLVFENNVSGGGDIGLELTGTLTITSAITQATSDTDTSNWISGYPSAETVALGGNVTLSTSNGGGIDLGNSTFGTTDTLSLGANTLTLNDSGGTDSGTIDDLESNITGTGSIVINSPATSYLFSGDSTYNGTTTIQSTGSSGVLAETSSTALGASAVTLSSGITLSFVSTGTSETIDNAITVDGSSSPNDLQTDIDFDNDSSTTGLTMTIPNITLAGDATFENDANSDSELMPVNLSGINANGHCVIYNTFVGGDTSSDAGFTNGPTACAVTDASSSTTTPGTPDTGSGLSLADIALPLVGAALLSSGLYIAGKRNIKITVKLR